MQLMSSYVTLTVVNLVISRAGISLKLKWHTIFCDFCYLCHKYRKITHNSSITAFFCKFSGDLSRFMKVTRTPYSYPNAVQKQLKQIEHSIFWINRILDSESPRKLPFNWKGGIRDIGSLWNRKCANHLTYRFLAVWQTIACFIDVWSQQWVRQFWGGHNNAHIIHALNRWNTTLSNVRKFRQCLKSKHKHKHKC